MSNPRISVVIPTRNRARCLAELIGTLRGQSLRDWEAIVIDDGSAPAQAQEVRALTRSDPRFVLLERDSEPQGGAHCRNIGARVARADLIVFFDDDDLFSSTCLEVRVRAMQEAPDQDFIVFPYERFRLKPGDLQTRHVADVSGAIDRYLRIDPPWHTGSVVWRRRFLDRLGGWNEQIASWQDWELGLRALCLRPTCASRPEPLFFVRVASEWHANISGAWSPKHVRSWPTAADAALSHLRVSGLMNGARSRLMGKLLLFIAERHLEIGDRAEALRLWAHARDERLVTGLEWRLGRALLRVFGAPPVRERVRFVLNCLFAARGLVERVSPGAGPRGAARSSGVGG
jgi:hypothetical protein